MPRPKGFKQPEYVKDKIRISNSVPRPWRRGIKLSKAHRKKLSIAMRRRYPIPFSFKKWRDSHKEQCKAYYKKYYSKPEVREHYRQYRKKHPFVMKKKWKIAKKLWHEKHKKRRYAEYKIYSKNNRFIMRAKAQRRIALERGAKGLLTSSLLQRVYEDNIKKYGTLTCYLCLKKIEFGNDHLEHKTPLSRGGTNFYRNLAVSCKMCNLSKRNKTLKEYKRYALFISSFTN